MCSVRSQVRSHTSQEPWALLHWDKHHCSTWRARRFHHLDFTFHALPSAAGQWHGHEDEPASKAFLLFLLHEFSVVTSEVGCYSGWWQKAVWSKCPGSKAAGESSPRSAHLPLFLGRNCGSGGVRKMQGHKYAMDQVTEYEGSQGKVWTWIILMPLWRFQISSQ